MLEDDVQDATRVEGLGDALEIHFVGPDALDVNLIVNTEVHPLRELLQMVRAPRALNTVFTRGPFDIPKLTEAEVRHNLNNTLHEG